MSGKEPSDAEGSDYSTEGKSILPGFLGRSFLAKFVISLLLVLVLVGGVSAYTFTQTSEQLSERVETEYVGIAEQGATQLDNWQNARGDTTVRLANLAAMETGNVSTVQNRIDEEMFRLPNDVAHLHYIDMDDGSLIATSQEAFQPTEIGGGYDYETLPSSTAPWITQGIEGLDFGDDNLYISEPIPAERQSNIFFVGKINTGDDRNIVLAMQANLDALAGDLGTGEQKQFTEVVNQDGKIVATSREEDVLSLAQGTNEFDDYIEGRQQQPPFVQEASGFVESTDLGGKLNEEYVAGYANVPDSNLVVVTHLPASQAFELRSTITESLGILVGTVVLGFLVIGFTFGRGTVNALSRLTQKAQELEAGNLDVDLSVNRADEFGSLTASFGRMRDALKEQIEEAQQARKEAEVSRAEAMEMNRYLEEKAQEYSETMERCATGDLTERMETDGENEAMDLIAEEFNNMIEELEKTTGQLKSFADEVETAGNVVQQSADSVREASEQVADSAQHVSDDAHEQRERLREISNDIDMLADRLDRIAADHPDLDFAEPLDRIDTIATTVADITELAETSMEETETVAGAAEEQAAELNEVSDRAGELVRYAGPLQEVLARFETEAEHEFYFPTGPDAGSTESQSPD